MEPYLAIASKRDERAYADAPVPGEVRQRILDAGRLSGSSRNRQRWEFVVVSGEAQDRLADAVYAPENVRSTPLVVAIVGEAGGFDVGRCAQNMMLAAWGEGVVSCPNGIRDAAAAAEICGGEVRAILSLGYPLRARTPASHTAEEWSLRANRKPLSELVREVS
ncbi:MAG TPA: nitroreductase family protein [Gaiellaceae bacterium]|nr:nitroreductase family protein [Gaiellaceae bacterium]